MRLHDYFDTVKGYKLSEQEKNALYERILRQTQYQRPLFSRARFYIKVAGYMTFLGLLGLSIYIPFLGQHSNNGTRVANTVNAEYIARVITVQGNYYIESDGKRIEGNNIGDGDYVTLTQGSSLIVHVGDTIEGKISGPATFVVNRSDKGFNITLKNGDYAEITTIGDQKTAPEVALISENHKFTARTQAGKSFHFVLTEENDKPLLVNKADEEIQIINEKTPNTPIFLAENKSVEVGTYIFATTAAPTEVAKIIARANPDNIDETKIGDSYDDSFFRGIMLASSEIAQESSNGDTQDMQTKSALPMMAATMASTQDIVDPISYNYDPIELRNNLIPQFVRVDIKYITYYYLNGQEHEYRISYENFLKRLYNIYDALRLEIPADGIMSSQKEGYSIEKLLVLATHIQNNLPIQTQDHHKKTVDTIVHIISKLGGQSFGAYRGQNLSLEEMFSKIQ